MSLSMDLHEALQEVPLNVEYFEKLEIYSQKLVQDYNWRRVSIYTTVEELKALATGARVSTNNNELAVKHNTGWVIITRDGYPITHSDETALTLPAYSIPDSIYQSPGNTSLNDSSQNDSQTT
jgi:hypothetical protein